MTEDEIMEEAYIAACELCGPNSPEFESVLEHMEDKLWQQYMQQPAQSLSTQ